MATKPGNTTARAAAEALFKRQREDGANEGRRIEGGARQADVERMAGLRVLRRAREEADRIAAQVAKAQRDRRRPEQEIQVR